MEKTQQNRSDQRVILLAHGSRQPGWSQPFLDVLQAMRTLQPGVDAQLVYLEFMQPDLGAALLQAAADGLEHVRLVPLFLGSGNHVQHDIARQIDAVRQQAPQLRIDCVEVAGTDSGVIEALARFALRQAGG